MASSAPYIHTSYQLGTRDTFWPIWKSGGTLYYVREMIPNIFIPLQCFRHSDLNNDRPSTEQFREKLPWFLDALPSADCAKGGHGAYTSSVDLNGL